jgi:hypothetical protein
MLHSFNDTHAQSPVPAKFARMGSLSHIPLAAPSGSSKAAVKNDSLENLFLEFFRTLAAINEKTTVDEVHPDLTILTVEIPGMGTSCTRRFSPVDGGQRKTNKYLHRHIFTYKTTLYAFKIGTSHPYQNPHSLKTFPCISISYKTKSSHTSIPPKIQPCHTEETVN